MAYTFPSSFRLKTKNQFRNIFHDAQRISGDYFLFFFKANTLGCPRLAIIVSKRSVRNAVDRNRLKRIIKESFRLHQHLISGYDVLIIVSKSIGRINNKELFQCLKKQWLQLYAYQKKV